MSFLVKNYGTSYISGQQDTTSYAWVESNIGKSPAILGLDFIEYSPSRVERGSTSTAVEDAIAFNARGGIVTFCWRTSLPPLHPLISLINFRRLERTIRSH